MAEKKANTGRLVDPLARREKWIMPEAPKQKTEKPTKKTPKRGTKERGV